jgi:hypothetical protein
MNKTADKMEPSNADFKDIKEMFKSSALYEDVFLIMAWCIVALFVVLVIWSLTTDPGEGVFASFGYMLIVVIFLFTAKSMYSKLHASFETPCDLTYIIESDNKLNVILSFIYFYIKTYVAVFLNIGIVLLIVYLLYIALQNNIHYDPSLSILIHKKMGVFEWTNIKWYVGWLYLILSLFYLFFVVSMMMMSLIEDQYETDKKGSSAINTKQNVGISLSVFFILFFIGMLYWIELLANFYAKLIAKHQHVSIKKLFETSVIFKNINVLSSEFKRGKLPIPQRQMTTFTRGLFAGFTYAFVIIPTFNHRQLCESDSVTVEQEGEDVVEEEERKIKGIDEIHKEFRVFKTRFLFGYYFITMLVVWLHMFDIISQLSSTLFSADS